MAKQDHITLVGVLHIIRGALALLLGMAAFTLLTGIGLFTEDPTAFGILGFIGTIAASAMLLLAVPSIVAGIGVLQRREWGRVIALIVGAISLLDFPLGTALGVYTLWLLMDNETRLLFAGPASVQPGASSLAVHG